MNRLFRKPDSGLAGYAALAAFAATYLTVLAIVLVPGLL